MMIKFLQINTDTRKKAHDLMTATTKQLDIDFCLLGEPNPTRTREWEGHTDAKVRVCNQSLYTPATGNGTGFSWVELNKIIVMSCYVSPNSGFDYMETVLDEISQLIREKEPLDYNFIIGGDFNAKSPEWGSYTTNIRGRILSEWIHSSNLCIVNVGNTPTFRREDQRSVIDVTFASEAIAGKISGWKVLEQETLSLHMYIYFELDLSLNPSTEDGTEVLRKWNVKTFNPDNFKQAIEEESRETTSTEEFMDIILKICEKSMKRAKKGKKKEVYWWNNTIKEKRALCVQKRRLYTRAGRRAVVVHTLRQELYAEYRVAKEDLAKEIQKSKDLKWKEVVNDLEKDIWGTGYKIVTKKLGTKLPNIPDDIRAQILTELFPEHPRVLFHKTDVHPNNIEEFTVDELLEAAEKTRPNKSPGPDQVPPKIVKEAVLEAPQFILQALNMLLKKGEFPSIWKEGRVVLIPKPKKAGQEQKYRPICLLNTFGKLYERLITKRLADELNDKNILSPNQYGFRPGRSTVHAIEKVTEIANNEINKGRSRTRKLCIVVTLDIRNAFSSASWRQIIETVTDNGVSPYLVNVIKSYLHDRRVESGNIVFSMSAGVPQGSILGPILWNILYDGVLRLDLPEDIDLFAYADDLVIVAKARTDNDLEEKTNYTLNKIQTWMESKQLEVAPEKSEAAVVSGKKKCRPLNIFINGQKIQIKKDLKYLGVIIDYRLSYSQHIEYVTEKANKTCMALSHILPRVGGAGENKRRVLQCATDSIILYAAPAWATCLQVAKYRQSVLSQQRKSLLRVCRGYRTLSTEAAAVLSRVIPIDLMAEERKATFGKTSEERIDEREITMRKWQSRWDSSKNGEWTRILIPNIRPWYDRKHGEITYELTQALSGHGSFRTYVHRIGKTQTAACFYCMQDIDDSPEHTLFLCARWAQLRSEAENRVSTDLRVDNLINLMLSDQQCWNSISEFITKVMREKQKIELQRETQITHPPPNIGA